MGKRPLFLQSTIIEHSSVDPLYPARLINRNEQRVLAYAYRDICLFRGTDRNWQNQSTGTRSRHSEIFPLLLNVGGDCLFNFYLFDAHLECNLGCSYDYEYISFDITPIQFTVSWRFNVQRDLVCSPGLLNVLN